MTELFEKVKAFGWENCYRLRSGRLEMIVTADVGPRILFFGLEGGKNMLKTVENQLGRTADLDWLLYGGHRLWAAPEDPYLSYLPDNQAVLVEFDNDDAGLSFIRPADVSGLERKLTILPFCRDQKIGENGCENGFTLADKRMKALGSFIVRNEIINRSQNVIKTASWGITSFAPGGIGYLPMEKKRSEKFQANRRLNLWDYFAKRSGISWEDNTSKFTSNGAKQTKSWSTGLQTVVGVSS